MQSPNCCCAPAYPQLLPAVASGCSSERQGQPERCTCFNSAASSWPPYLVGVQLAPQKVWASREAARLLAAALLAGIRWLAHILHPLLPLLLLLLLPVRLLLIKLLLVGLPALPRFF